MTILERIRERLAERRNEERPQIDDDETRDNYLRSLRRQRRVQLEQLEKEKLIKDIKEHEKKMMQENVMGFKDNLKEKKQKLLKQKSFKPKKNISFFDKGFV